MDIQNKNKILIIAVLILLTANISTFSIILINKNKLDKSHQVDTNSKKKKKKKNNMFFNDLNLTKEQKTFFEEERSNHFVKSKEIRSQIKKQKREIHNEVFKSNPNIEHISFLSDSIGNLNAEFEKENYNHFIRLNQVLEPDQKEKFKQIVNKASFRKDKNHKSTRENKK